VTGARLPGRRGREKRWVNGKWRVVWFHEKQIGNHLFYSHDDGETWVSRREVSFWWAEREGKVSFAQDLPAGRLRRYKDGEVIRGEES
jgi:hypothetical protein